MELIPGLTGRAQGPVTEAHTAAACGSGSLPVLGTPYLLALMEEATCACVAPALPEGDTTVGVSVALSHTAPSPVGIAVEARATLTAVEGKMLTFAVEAFDACGLIGKAEIRRCIVHAAPFLEKAQQRLSH